MGRHRGHIDRDGASTGTNRVMAAALWSEVTPAECHGNGGEVTLLRHMEATAYVPVRLVLSAHHHEDGVCSRGCGHCILGFQGALCIFHCHGGNATSDNARMAVVDLRCSV
jgi:hypothetical protein